MFHGLVRGMLPLFLLRLLRDRPLPGIDMMRSIEQMSEGAWKPSPGSVYPLLRRLERDGLVKGKWRRTKGAPKRVYHVTAKGRSRIPGMQREILSELYAAQYIVDAHIVALEAELDRGDNGKG
jgi:DNA-binding PadR family transcriptional regulator